MLALTTSAETQRRQEHAHAGRPIGGLVTARRVCTSADVSGASPVLGEDRNRERAPASRHEVERPRDEAEWSAGTRRLAVLLAMAMFVLVVDTSLMNVSIAAVVEDLDTTVSGVQGAIALEALVSAAFILIGSKVADLIGRKRAFVLGLLGYATGAIAMTFAQGLTAIIVFWAVIGGLGASLLLPSMQSLIHGNFEGAAQKKAYALVGAAAAIAAAVGPLLGGFLTTVLSWRVGFVLEAVVIAVVLPACGTSKTCPTRARARSTPSVPSSRRSGWAASSSASSSGRRVASTSAS